MTQSDSSQSKPQDTLRMLQRGRLKLISNNRSNEINYIVVPKGFLNARDLDKTASKMFNALQLPRPEMIFQVPQSFMFQENFIHDCEDIFDESWEKKFKDFLQPLLEDDKFKNPTTNKVIDQYLRLCNTESLDKLKWSRHTTSLAIWILQKYLNQSEQEAPSSIRNLHHPSHAQTRSYNRTDSGISTTQQQNNEDDQNSDSDIESPSTTIRIIPENDEDIISEPQTKDAATQLNFPLHDSDLYSKNTDEVVSQISSNTSTKLATISKLFTNLRSSSKVMLNPTQWRKSIENISQNNDIIEKKIDTIKLCNLSPDQVYRDLLEKLENQEHHRHLVLERIATMIRGITDACRQATAFIWMTHKRHDILGRFVADNAKAGTIIIGDAIFDSKKMWTSDDIKDWIINSIKSDKITSMEIDPWNMFRESFKADILKYSVSFDPDHPNDFPPSLELNSILMIKELEDLIHKTVEDLISKDVIFESDIRAKGLNWSARLDRKKPWLDFCPYEEHNHLLDYFELPKSGLTHLIFWEDNTDFLTWESYLQQSFPLGLFLIGGKNNGFELASRCLRENQPLFVFEGTGGSASIISQVIKFMKCRNRPFSRPSFQEIQQFPAVNKLFSRPERAHLAFASEFYLIQKQARVLLRNWPDYFNSDAVLNVNIMNQSIENLQDQITKTMNAVFEELPELGSHREDKKRIKYAWKQYDMLKKNAASLNLIGTTYIRILSLLSFITTLITIFGGMEQYATYLSIPTVILPILTGVVITMLYTFKPIEKWAVCKIGACLIKSEIYKFRTRTGIYRVSRQQLSAAQQTEPITNMEDYRIAARRLFSAKLMEVWKSLEVSEMKLGALNHLKKQTDNFNSFDQEDSLEDDEDDPPDFAEINSKENLSCNACGKLSVENYVKYRLKEQLDYYKVLSPRLKRSLQCFQIMIFLCTAAGSLLAHLGFSRWVPALMAFIASITTIMEQKQYSLRLSASNSVQMQLEQLKCYWQGLSIIERRKFVNASYMVETTEATVVSQYTAYTQAVRTSVKKHQDETKKEN